MNYKPIRISEGARPEQGKMSSEERRHPSSADDSLERDSSSLLQRSGGHFDGTVIYVHGIANKPQASTLKCQWDRALFGTGMGQRSRMVYWVNRDRYPDPYPATCNDEDYSEEIGLGDDDEESLKDDAKSSRMNMAQLQVERLLKENPAPEKQRSKWLENLRQLADRIESNAAHAQIRTGHKQAEVVPLPSWARERLTRMFTKLLINDVYDYFFDARKSAEIDTNFQSRLSGGPFVVVGHSLGSVIAYYNLCQNESLPPNSVRLFLTIGSPLGLEEVQDNLKEKLGVDQLVVPNCVANWVNIADRFDPVAFDPRLNSDFEGSIDDVPVRNIHRPRHPHSATGYLSLPKCQRTVREIVGAAFAQPISPFSIARDLTDQIEDSLSFFGDDETSTRDGEKHHVLIELNEHRDNDLSAARERLLAEIENTLTPASFKSIEFIQLRRYVAADLTSAQIESLGPVLQKELVGRIWNDAEKMSLALPTTVPREDPIQSAAAARVYGANGADIHWAVLDTGIEANHPHFQTHNNIVQSWDCTHSNSELDWSQARPEDLHGHGTHVAAIIAGSVLAASGDPKARHGVAPQTKLHSYKVLDAGGRGRDSYIIRALDHIASVNEASSSNVVHGVNLSLGGPFDPETYGCGHSPICRELRRLWRQGVLVVVAAGNAGFVELQSSRGSLRANLDLTIGDPANLEESIAVGSVHLSNPLTYGTSYFSSRGPTADGRQKPDLVAPGERVRSANYAYRYTDDYIELSGTSMAAPHVSGLLAAFLSQRRELIGEPDRVKSLLLANCTDLKRDSYVQGAGMPNLVRMLLAT